jgi:hypothetical protein
MAVIDCLEDRDETLKRKTVSQYSYCCYRAVHCNLTCQCYIINSWTCCSA